MAEGKSHARHRVGLAEKTRERIQASMIVNRLTNHILGKCEMSATQVQAARILLNKSLPDLQSLQHTGEGGGPIKTAIEVSFVSAQNKG